MRIAFLANGQSVHTKKWLSFFVDKEYDIHLITFTAGKRIGGVKTHNLRYFRKLAYLFRIWEVKKVVKDINPDVLHAHFLSHYGMYGALTGFRPFVVSAWGSDVLIDPKRSRLKRYVVKYVVRSADVVTVNAEFLMKSVADLGASKERVRFVGHGVDPKKFCREIKNKALKERLKIPVSSPVIISTRSLKPIYNIETLIKAIPLVLESRTDTYFVIVGGGSLRQPLKAMVDQLKISENVKFVGTVPHLEVQDFLAMSDVYVSTSLSDTTPVSLLEAMACKLPVVVTNIEGNREWVKDGANGLLFPKRNFGVLAEKILYLLGDQNTRRQFGILNRKIVKKRGNYKKEMGEMEQIYRNLVEAYKR